jgi:hypothetical protein
VLSIGIILISAIGTLFYKVYSFGKEKKVLMVAKLMKNNEEFKYHLEFPCPHYPCEQLWGMLPEVIETYYSFGINKKGLGYLHDINSEDVLHWVSFNNLQEALLDMVLWAIEQNHIKKVSDG